MTHASTSPLKSSAASASTNDVPHYSEPLSIRACERGWIPDSITRHAIRRLCRQRLAEEHHHDLESRDALFHERLQAWRQGPLAVSTGDANDQHYEVPAAFYELVLGSHLKYSCSWWPDGVNNLDDAEAAMLELTCSRAGLENGMDILELGCGWGSLSLWMARNYPNSRITAISNSHSQRTWIMNQASNEGLSNITVITSDINDFDIESKFDRVISIEMFEHLRNHSLLFERIHGWLHSGGKMFCHVFCHRELTYPYDSQSQGDWMSRHFFTGGIMPGFDLFLHYQDHLRCENRWWLNGRHYEKTSNAWLARQDAAADEIIRIFEQHYPPAQARIMHQRWRMFFMAVAELFGYEHGQQWGVGHYLFNKP